RSERSTAADCDSSRQRLEHGDLWRDLALVGEYLLHRLRNAVAANRSRSIACHQSDDDAADHWDDHHPDAEVVVGGRDAARRESAEEGDVGDERDRGDEESCDSHSAHANDYRKTGNDQRSALFDVVEGWGVL